jgi:MEDS: MEthanogen/methylotroph, DcmR Sensory domain
MDNPNGRVVYGGEDMGNEHSVELAGRPLGRERHICALFNSIEEEHQVLRSFIKEGFEGQDRAVHIVDPEQRHDHIERLRAGGIDVEPALARGQLEVRPWQDAYLRRDRFDQDAMIALIEELLRAGSATGYRRTRLLAHMEWALLDKPGVEDLVEYETRLNYVLPKYEDPVVCSYDLSKFGARVVVDIMRTHPVVIVGGVLQENPFFVPPDEFLLELRERGAARLVPRVAH